MRMETTLEHQNQIIVSPKSRPLASPALAAVILDCTTHTIADYIHDGTLPLSFDIKSPGKTRLCLRMATSNVLAFQSGLMPSSDLQKFFDTAFPRDKPLYSPPRLAWILHCEDEHIYHLLATGALIDAGDSNRHKVPRHSVIDFLQKRRLA
jgi:hypothetical protein